MGLNTDKNYIFLTKFGRCRPQGNLFSFENTKRVTKDFI